MVLPVYPPGRRPHPHVTIRPGVWPAGPQAGQRIDHERKRFVLDFYFFDGFGGRQFIDSRQGKDGGALVQRLHAQCAFPPFAGLDHGAGIRHEIARGRKIVGGDNSPDTRHCQCGFGINPLYAGMGHGTQQ